MSSYDAETKSSLDEHILEKLKSIDLPKWTGCVIRGENVSSTLAERICVQTCSFDVWSNYKKLTNDFENAFGIPEETPESDNWKMKQKVYDELKEKYGLIHDLEYLKNTVWCSSCMSQDSWITWNGVVSFDANLGKRPQAIEVYDEWKLIAERFPELSLKCQLYPCEIGEIHAETYKEEPLLQFTIANGKVSVEFEDYRVMTPIKEDIEASVYKMMFMPNGGEGKIAPERVPAILARVEKWWASKKSSK
ncbi:MAG: hypothetical protein Edafosvirus1_65 [Edafosvirus sp.]|uniref:Uncharacterized protein n=1 Tax=Edafosvirus sp. TaxID=2487765 RepID=A0A3G4ZTT2_9VIRU|nr:MAG: hypothetical protein Edafosvirus1_65 [Edafosvirus sp.]